MSSKKIRVLAIGHSYVVGVNRALIREVARDQDFEITIAAPEFFQGDLRPLVLDEEPADSALKLVGLPAKRTQSIHIFGYDNQALRRLIGNGDFDVVHAWEEPYIYAGYQIANAVKKTAASFCFRTAQNYYKWYVPPFNLFERAVLARAQGWIAGGELVYRTMLKRGYPAERGRVLTLAVDRTTFKPSSNAERATVARELNLTPPIIGFVGRLTKSKGLDVLMRAIELLKPSTPWSLLLLGSGAYREKVEAWAQQHGWAERVVIKLVKHEDTPRYLGVMDIVVAPSQTTLRWREQFGRMLIEAFACGVPVIASDSGEIPLVVDDVGRIVPESDVLAWAQAIEALLEDQIAREALAAKGLQRSERYSVDTVAEQYRDYYRQLAEHQLGSTSKRSWVNVSPNILATATQGTGGNDENRLRALLSNFSTAYFPFDYQAKLESFIKLLQRIRRERPDLVVMEGTGAAGGMSVLLGRLITKVPYIVSSGDAVGPFVAAHYPLLGPLFGFYERVLYRYSAGVIGWSPYLVGRALSFGASRVMTAPGWSPYLRKDDEKVTDRVRIRKALGIPLEAIVFGIVGSLAWTKRVGYCYGWELVKAVSRVERPNIKVLVIGAGDGLAYLQQAAGNQLGRTVFLTGQVPRDQVPAYLAAMDIAGLPQSVNQVGGFRYTTKLSEYLASGLPIVMGQTPLAYDLDGDWLWRLPGDAPWDERYIEALAKLMNTLTVEEIEAKQSAVPRNHPEFDRERQITRITAFINDLLDDQRSTR